MSGPVAPPIRRISEVLCAVVRQALEDRGLSRVALLDDETPEVELAARLLEPLGSGTVVRVCASAEEVESLLHPDGADVVRARAELARLRARLTPGALPAHPANRTALLLGGELPPEPLLPLGDLSASRVRALHGGWSGPAGLLELAEAVGGIEVVDAELSARLDGGPPTTLSCESRAEIDALLARGRASRLHAHVVPKIGRRTLTVDLAE